MKYDKCPKCGNEDLDDRWSSKGRRLLEQYCNAILEDEDLFDADGRSLGIPTREEFNHNTNMLVQVCTWVGEARIPETVKISRTASHHFNRSGKFSIYDRFGHDMCLSQGFKSKDEAMSHILQYLTRGLTDPDVGPYTALWWINAGAYNRGIPVTLDPVTLEPEKYTGKWMAGMAIRADNDRVYRLTYLCGCGKTGFGDAEDALGSMWTNDDGYPVETDQRWFHDSFAKGPDMTDLSTRILVDHQDDE